MARQWTNCGKIWAKVRPDLKNTNRNNETPGAEAPGAINYFCS